MMKWKMRWAWFIPVWFRVKELSGPKGAEFHTFLFLMWCYIDPKYKDDEGLYQHELVHAKQHIRTFFLQAILYRVSRKYRLNAELEAYCYQLNFYDESRHANLIWLFGGYIADWYDLDISQSEAAAMLSEMFYIKG